MVGAGFAGLTAARELVESGRRVVVLEARDRVSGRVCTVEAADTSLDMGAQWLGRSQTRIRALAAELGVWTFP